LSLKPTMQEPIQLAANFSITESKKWAESQYAGGRNGLKDRRQQDQKTNGRGKQKARGTLTSTTRELRAITNKPQTGVGAV